jgi:hypothetical protein
MFGFLKSGLNAARLKMFEEDFAILRDDMPIDHQLHVYRLMRDDYNRLVNAASSGASSLGKDAKQIILKAMKDRNAASARWHDKRNPDWMAASMTEHLCNSIVSEDMDTFQKIYTTLSGWMSGMEMIDL